MLRDLRTIRDKSTSGVSPEVVNEEDTLPAASPEVVDARDLLRGCFSLVFSVHYPPPAARLLLPFVPNISHEHAASVLRLHPFQ